MGQGIVMGATTMKRTATTRRLLCTFAAGLALLAATEKNAEAQEILLTGPLAGAPAVRKLRLYREKRIEIAPLASFTLLDEYQREILFGARINYNITDWLAIGAYGAYGAVKIPTSLSDKIQGVNENRRKDPNYATTTDGRLTAVNLGQDFRDQLGSMDWIVAPQLTGVPFRGKLALFQSIYVDTDLYFFAGPAFIGVTERKDCEAGTCTLNNNPDAFKTASRVAIAPTFGLGFTFYVNKWNAIGFEWRGLPFAWNTGGIDTKGGGKDNEFPDDKISAEDRQFHFNQLLTISYNFYFPQDYRVSE